MFLWIRQRTASFCCGYLLVEFYNRAQNEMSGTDGHADPAKLKRGPIQQHKSYFPSFLSTPPPPVQLARPSDDLQFYIVEYDVMMAVVIAALVFSGGLSGIAGATSALLLECSDDGPRLYGELQKSISRAEREMEALQNNKK